MAQSVADYHRAAGRYLGWVVCALVVFGLEIWWVWTIPFGTLGTVGVCTLGAIQLRLWFGVGKTGKEFDRLYKIVKAERAEANPGEEDK